MKYQGHFAAVLVGLVLGGCGASARLGIGDKKEEPKVPQAVDLTRENTPANRATQVGWTAARAQYCAFNMRPDKLRADYLAYEGKQGISPDELAKVTRVYDLTYNTFYTQVREIPTYCTRAQIEEIRPDINRHLAGDYTPAKRAPVRAEVELPNIKREDASWEKRKRDPAQHEDPR